MLFFVCVQVEVCCKTFQGVVNSEVASSHWNALYESEYGTDGGRLILTKQDAKV